MLIDKPKCGFDVPQWRIGDRERWHVKKFINRWVVFDLGCPFMNFDIFLNSE